MRKRTARLQAHELLGEPSLTALLSDPVMTSLWRADRIDPDEARQLFAETSDKLQRRTGPQRNIRQRERPSSRRERSDRGYRNDDAFALT